MSALVVAGEASGDRYASQVARLLAQNGIHAFGIGGAASSAAGVDLVGRLESFTAMGGIEVARRLPALLRAHQALVHAVKQRRPRVALLFGFSEYCGRLGRKLRSLGVHVLWCMPPQVWAWRPWRKSVLARSTDRMAVTLPFEEPLWRSAGAEVRYVGHPVLDVMRSARPVIRSRLGVSDRQIAVALLPGSRPQEVRLLAPAMIEALQLLRARSLPVVGRLFVSSYLDGATREWLYKQAAGGSVAPCPADSAHEAAASLHAFDACIVASGTATLEAALSGIPSIIVYRMAKTSFFLARLLVRVPHIGLPNLLLGRRAYPELLQSDATADRMANALGEALMDGRAFELAADELQQLLRSFPVSDVGGETVAERTFGWIADWFR